VTLVKEPDGDEVYDIALPLDYGKGTLRAGYYKKQIDQSSLDIIRLLAFGALLALVAALFFAYFFTKALLKPLDNLRDSVQKAAGGDLTVQAKIIHKDELGFLAARSITWC